MSESHDTYRDLCAGYALGILDEGDRRLFEEHLGTGCPGCEAALAQDAQSLVLLAVSAPPARPSAALRGRVLDAVGAEAGRAAESDRGSERERGTVVEWRPKRARPAWAWGWAAAAAALAIAAGLGWNAASRLRADLQAARAREVALERRLEEERSWARVFAAPGARTAELAPTPAGDRDLRGRAVYDPATRRAVVLLENVRAPSGHDYQLWAIRGAVPASLGLIRPDASGRAELRLENVGDPSQLNAFAVSLEPQGGSPDPNKPSGPVVMVGPVGG